MTNKLYSKAIPLWTAALFLTACSFSPGAGPEDNTGSPEGTLGNSSPNSGENDTQDFQDVFFVPTFFTLESSYIDYSGIHFFGDKFCYLSMEQNPETQQYVQTINSCSTEGKTVSSAPLLWPEDQENIHLSRYVFEEDGSLRALASSYFQNPQTGRSGSRDFLCSFDTQGNCVSIRDITEDLREDPESQTYIGAMGTDRENRVYLQGNETIWLYDAQGNLQGSISPGSSENTGMAQIDSMFLSGEGSMYITYTSPGSPSPGCTLAEIDFETVRLNTVSSRFPDRSQCSPGPEGTLLMRDSRSLYVYDPLSEKEELLLNWMDCNINGNQVLNFWEGENGEIAAVLSGSGDSGGEIALLAKTDGSQAVQKENLVLAVLSDGYIYYESVVDFNRKNQKYHITIKEYRDPDSENPVSRADALSRLYADLVSGSCPDILELTGLDVKQLAEKGAFVDLSPYVDDSPLLHTDDFVEEVLNAYTFDDKLVSIPFLFFLETILGNSDQVGTEAGWTLEELISLGDSHPEAELFDGAGKQEILNFVMRYNPDAFIDWETGECNFDSLSFQNLLEFVNRAPRESASGPDRPTTPVRIQNGEVLLKNTYLYDFDSIQMDWEMFRGNAACIGFPSPDGSSRHTLYTAFAYAIPANAAQKDGAWTFIESLLAEEKEKDNDRNQMGFPTVKRRLEAMIQDAVKIEYLLDDNGEPCLDDNGEPVIIGDTQTSSTSDGWSYTYHTATREEVDRILALLEGARLTEGENGDEIAEIILQEAEAFFQGQKTVKEVSDIIQNRVSVYVKEHM